jgi:hypothetical protein
MASACFTPMVESMAPSTLTPTNLNAVRRETSLLSTFEIWSKRVSMMSPLSWLRILRFCRS